MNLTHKILLEKYRKLIESEVIIEGIMDKLIERDYGSIDKHLVRLTENDVIADDEANMIARDLDI